MYVKYNGLIRHRLIRIGDVWRDRTDFVWKRGEVLLDQMLLAVGGGRGWWGIDESRKSYLESRRMEYRNTPFFVKLPQAIAM
jgi:hypothetical protein